MTAPTMTRRVLTVELRDEFYAIIREPAAVFFSIALPVIFFALFASLLADESERSVSVATLMLASFGTFGVVGVALLNPGIGVAEDRERGWLRVKRVSPVPVTTTLAAKVAAGLPVAFGVFAAMSLTALALGAFETDLVTWSKLAGILLAGSLPFALLGLAVGFMTSARLAPVVLNAIFFTGRSRAVSGSRWKCCRASLHTWLPGCRRITLHSWALASCSVIRSPTTSSRC